MDFVKFSLSGFDDFLVYAGLAIAFIYIYMIAYLWITPYNELKLIKDGNIAAALIEPAWKMLLSNKALLVLLWELNYGHPNLLPAYFTPQKFGADYVRKPLLSREGANVTIRSRGVVREQPGGYGGEGYIYQGTAPLPAFDNRYPVIGAWIVGDQPAGIGIREDDSPITKNSSRFLPHYFS